MTMHAKRLLKRTAMGKQLNTFVTDCIFSSVKTYSFYIYFGTASRISSPLMTVFFGFFLYVKRDFRDFRGILLIRKWFQTFDLKISSHEPYSKTLAPDYSEFIDHLTITYNLCRILIFKITTVANSFSFLVQCLNT